MQIKITENLLKNLEGMRLNLTHYYLLLAARDGTYNELDAPNHHLTMKRKKWVVDGKITELGALLLKSLTLKKGDEKFNIGIGKLKDEKLLKFEAFWSAYPSSATWTTPYGTKLEGRMMKIPSKKMCEEKFYKCLEEIEKKGRTIEDVIKAINREVEFRKKTSMKSGKNELMYMQNVGTYIHQRSYEAYWDLDDVEPEKKTAQDEIRSNISNSELI